MRDHFVIPKTVVRSDPDLREYSVASWSGLLTYVAASRSYDFRRKK